MMKISKNVALMLFVLALTLALGACNTVRGVGQDLSGGATTVQGWMN